MAERKWYSLADKVWNGSNLSRAAASVLANAGRAGVDHESCLRFEEHLGDRLESWCKTQKVVFRGSQPCGFPDSTSGS